MFIAETFEDLCRFVVGCDPDDIAAFVVQHEGATLDHGGAKLVIETLKDPGRLEIFQDTMKALRGPRPADRADAEP